MKSIDSLQSRERGENSRICHIFIESDKFGESDTMHRMHIIFIEVIKLFKLEDCSVFFLNLFKDHHTYFNITCVLAIWH